MSTHLTPYLSFKAEAREALDFYASIFGGEPQFTLFKEFGMGSPADAEHVMHGQLTTPDGHAIMASDAPEGMPVDTGSTMSLTLSGDAADSPTLHGWFEALAEGGTVRQPLEMSPWGDEFGMLEDRFGVAWMVNVAVAAPSPAPTA